MLFRKTAENTEYSMRRVELLKQTPEKREEGSDLSVTKRLLFKMSTFNLPVRNYHPSLRCHVRRAIKVQDSI